MTTTAIPVQPIEEIYSFGAGENSDLSFDLEWIEKTMARDLGDLPNVVLETRKAIQFYLDSGAEFLGYGRTRICFADGADRIIKIPFTLEGYQGSSREVSTYENFQKNPDAGWIPTAECSFVKIKGADIWLLSMERLLEFPKFGEPRPKWVDSVDCGQVGYNSKGELVAYDL